MKITVIGCGRWGSFIAWYLDKINHKVALYRRESSKHMQEFIKTRSNGLLTLNKTVELSNSLDIVEVLEAIVISINSQGLQKLMEELKKYELVNKIIILCMKGIEIVTGKRLSQIAINNLDSSNQIAVWLGSGHVRWI